MRRPQRSPGRKSIMRCATVPRQQSSGCAHTVPWGGLKGTPGRRVRVRYPVVPRQGSMHAGSCCTSASRLIAQATMRCTVLLV